MSVAFSPDGRQIVSGAADGMIKIWDSDTGACTQTLKGHGDAVASVAFSPDGWRMASGAADGTIKVWDGETGTCTQTLQGFGGWVTLVTCIDDVRRLFVRIYGSTRLPIRASYRVRING